MYFCQFSFKMKELAKINNAQQAHTNGDTLRAWQTAFEGLCVWVVVACGWGDEFFITIVNRMEHADKDTETIDYQ